MSDRIVLQGMTFIAMRTFAEADPDAIEKMRKVLMALERHIEQARVLRAPIGMNLYIIPFGTGQAVGGITNAFNSIGAKTHQEMGCYFVATNQEITADWVKTHLGNVAGITSSGTSSNASGLLVIPVGVGNIGNLMTYYPTGLRNFLAQNFAQLQSVAA